MDAPYSSYLHVDGVCCSLGIFIEFVPLWFEGIDELTDSLKNFWA